MQVLTKSQSLLGKLSVEHARWQEREKEISSQLQLLPSGSLLAAAFVTYLGGASEDVRSDVVSKWREYKCYINVPYLLSLVGQKDWEFLRFLSTETELTMMRKDGLPSDALSAENALIIKWTVGFAT